jgi:hypothetical protein
VNAVSWAFWCGDALGSGGTIFLGAARRGSKPFAFAGPVIDLINSSAESRSMVSEAEAEAESRARMRFSAPLHVAAIIAVYNLAIGRNADMVR